MFTLIMGPNSPPQILNGFQIPMIELNDLIEGFSGNLQYAGPKGEDAGQWTTDCKAI